MKKSITFILLMFTFMIIYNTSVNAEEYDYKSDTDYYNYKEIDDNGLMIKGSIVKEDYSGNSLNRTKEKYEGVGLYIKQQYNKGQDRIDYYLYRKSGTGSLIRDFFMYNTSDMSEPTTSGSVDNTWSNGYLITYDKQVSTTRYTQLMGTNIPIFDGDSEEFQNNVDKYLNDGDMSGAENYYDLNNPEQSDDVLLPKNLRTYGKVFNMSDATLLDSYEQISTGTTLELRWDTPDNNTLTSYSYDVRMKVNYVVNDNNNLLTSSWVNLVSDYPYEAHQYVDINTGKDVPRTSDISETCKIKESHFAQLGFNWSSVNGWHFSDKKCAVKKVTIEVRNRCDGKVSNWVSVDSSSGSGYNSTSVKDNDGNVVDDDYYHGQDTSNNDASTYYDNDSGTHGDTGNSEFTFNSIMQFIRDGFGLLGNGGIISLMSKTFLYLPNSIWTILKFFVAMMVAVAMVKLVKDVIL